MNSRTVKFCMTGFTKLAFENLIFSGKASTPVSQKAKMFIIKLTSLQNFKCILKTQKVQYRIFF